MRIYVLLAVLVSGPTAVAAAPDYAIVNAKTVTADSTEEEVRILIRDGRIAAIGRDVAIPNDVRIFDAKGLTVYPGLVDGLSHYGVAAAAPAGPAPPGARPPEADSELPSNAPERYLNPRPWGVQPQVRIADRLSASLQPDTRRAFGYALTLAAPREGQWQGISALVSLGPANSREAVLVSPVALHAGFDTRPARGRYPNSLMGVFAFQCSTASFMRD